MIVPRIINMISHMDTCQSEWKELLEQKKNKSLAIMEENISKIFDFTFNKESKTINPKATKLFQIKLFIQHDMFKALVSVSIQSWDLYLQHNSLFLLSSLFIEQTIYYIY